MRRVRRLERRLACSEDILRQPLSVCACLVSNDKRTCREPTIERKRVRNSISKGFITANLSEPKMFMAHGNLGEQGKQKIIRPISSRIRPLVSRLSKRFPVRDDGSRHQRRRSRSPFVQIARPLSVRAVSPTGSRRILLCRSAGLFCQRALHEERAMSRSIKGRDPSLRTRRASRATDRLRQSARPSIEGDRAACAAA